MSEVAEIHTVKKVLPMGVSRRKDGRYQARFNYLGKRYYVYDFSLSRLQAKMFEKRADFV